MGKLPLPGPSVKALSVRKLFQDRADIVVEEATDKQQVMEQIANKRGAAVAALHLLVSTNHCLLNFDPPHLEQ
jgi:hypothetical protein